MMYRKSLFHLFPILFYKTKFVFINIEISCKNIKLLMIQFSIFNFLNFEIIQYLVTPVHDLFKFLSATMTVIDCKLSLYITFVCSN